MKTSYFVASVVLVAGFLGLGMLITGDENKVPNCWDKSEDCVYEELEKTYTSCNEWYIADPEEELECEWTEEGVESIKLVTDPGNHVPGPVTEEEYEIELYDNGVTGQQDLEFLPDGDLLIGDQSGGIHRGEPEDMAQISYLRDVFGEELGEFVGVKGMAVDPDFEDNNKLYIYYSISETEETGFEAEMNHGIWEHRVSSFRLDEEDLQHSKDLITFDGAFWHTGGGVEIGPDNKLYVTVGDADEPVWSHDKDSYRGKTLRVNLDGTVPKGNPYEDSIIYTMGHRNHQGISWDPETDNIWSAEHGGERNDEINILEKGENYGWGAEYSCGVEMNSSIDVQDIKEPVQCYEDWTMAPSRTEFVDDETHPWYGDMFVAGLRGKHLRRYDVEGTSIVDEELFYFNEESPDKTGVARRLRDVEFHEGSLWLIGDIGREEPAAGVIQIKPEN